jgi:hypothetical protein
MTFAAPTLLAALALLLPVLLAFLVRRRRRVLRVPSVLLFRLAGAPTTQNRRFRDVKRLASLLACLLAVAALVTAAARPGGRDRGETVALVIDASASMAAGGRDAPLEQARRFVARTIAGGGAGDRYAIIAAGASPLRLAGPVAPGPELEEGLARLHAERGAADLEAAVELAASLVAKEPGARIVVLGDGGESAGGLVAAREVPVSRRAFPLAARDNLGVVTLATRPVLDARGGDEREALVTLATSSTRPRVARLTLSADGHEIAERRVELGPLGEAEIRLRVPASVARLVARVRPDDGVADALGSDDEASLDGAARALPRVVLTGADAASTPAFFAEKALAAAGVKEIVQAPADLSGVELGPTDLVVVLGDGPPRRLDAPTLYLATRTGALPFGGFRELTDDATHLRSVEGQDPVLRGVALDGLTIQHATAAAVPPGARALVELDGGAVMLAGGAGRGAWVYLGIDPARSDLVLRVAFPVLVANAVHALGGASDVLVADTVARSEITLREAAAEPAGASLEPDARFRLPASPTALLALLGAALLALEAWAYRKGWAT